jgi:hypothetical protein
VFSVTENVPVALAIAVSDGKTAWLSVLEKCTVPE